MSKFYRSIGYVDSLGRFSIDTDLINFSQILNLLTNKNSMLSEDMTLNFDQMHNIDFKNLNLLKELGVNPSEMYQQQIAGGQHGNSESSWTHPYAASVSSSHNFANLGLSGLSDLNLNDNSKDAERPEFLKVEKVEDYNESNSYYNYLGLNKVFKKFVGVNNSTEEQEFAASVAREFLNNLLVSQSESFV